MIIGNTSSQGKFVNAPTSVSASAGNAQASVSFTLPAYDGKGVATYTATSSPSGITGSGSGSPIVVTGLSNGTAYTFTVTTVSGYGLSAVSGTSNSVNVGAPPGAPTIGTAAIVQNVDRNIDVPYTAGSAGTGATTFTATSSPGGITATGASPIRVSGLTAGQAYTFTVTASNAYGSQASAASNSVTAGNRPGLPVIGAPTAGNAQVLVRWTPAADGTGATTITLGTYSGGNFVKSETVTAEFFDGASRTWTVYSLNNGTAYTFQIGYSNSYGGQSTAQSSAATPVAPPFFPPDFTTASTTVSTTPNPCASYTCVSYPTAPGNTFLYAFIDCTPNTAAQGCFFGGLWNAYGDPNCGCPATFAEHQLCCQPNDNCCP